MMTTTKPDLLMVTTVDATHHEFIIKGLDMGCDVQDIPWRREEKVNQAELHAQEMSQQGEKEFSDYDEVMVMDNFEDYEKIRIPRGGGGHGGGDRRLQDKIFRNPDMPDPYQHAAGSRDGAMSVLIGIAARKSIEENRMIRIADLTDLQPAVKRIT
jgi:hypothetical protein